MRMGRDPGARSWASPLSGAVREPFAEKFGDEIEARCLVGAGPAAPEAATARAEPGVVAGNGLAVSDFAAGFGGVTRAPKATLPPARQAVAWL